MSTPTAGPGLKTMAAATATDYARDPTRWGSAEVAAHFPNFAHLDVRTSGAVIRLRHGGSGPPLLLVHGNPQNHTCWYKVAARLAKPTATSAGAVQLLDSIIEAEPWDVPLDGFASPQGVTMWR